MAKRLGIITLPLNYNYGGILQAVALYQFLTRHGFDVTLLNKKRFRPPWQLAMLSLLKVLPGQNLLGVRGRERQEQIHRPFIRQHIPQMTKTLRDRKSLARAAIDLNLDAVIVGSDQVWRNDYFNDIEFMNYFLDFVENDTPKIAYGASFGQSVWLNKSFTPQVARLLNRFESVSVREDDGLEICRHVFGRSDCRHVLDPTLLMDKLFYQNMVKLRVERPIKNLLLYVLDAPAKLNDIIQMVLKGMGPDTAVRRLSDGSDNKESVPEWLSAFMNADFVVTDSFHGMIFSIIFEKQFLAIPNPRRGESRFTSLAKQLNISNNMITSNTNMYNIELHIDYESINSNIIALRSQSEEFILSALK